MTRKAIPLNALRCCRGVFWQNPFLRPDVPVSTGLITAKSLSTPRYPGIDGAYSSKIPFCAPISCQRRGLLRQNPYLRPDILPATGLITAKSLSVPRCTKVEGIIDLILSHIPASVKVGGYNRPDFVSHTRFRKFCWVQMACF